MRERGGVANAESHTANPSFQLLQYFHENEATVMAMLFPSSVSWPCSQWKFAISSFSGGFRVSGVFSRRVRGRDW